MSQKIRENVGDDLKKVFIFKVEKGLEINFAMITEHCTCKSEKN